MLDLCWVLHGSNNGRESALFFLYAGPTSHTWPPLWGNGWSLVYMGVEFDISKKRSHLKALINISKMLLFVK